MTENTVQVGGPADILLSNGERFLADRHALQGDLILVEGDWQRAVELIGMPTTTLAIPTTSIVYMELFDAEGEAEEVQA